MDGLVERSRGLKVVFKLQDELHGATVCSEDDDNEETDRVNVEPGTAEAILCGPFEELDSIELLPATALEGNFISQSVPIWSRP